MGWTGCGVDRAPSLGTLKPIPFSTTFQQQPPQHNIKEVLLFPAMKPDQARQLQNAQIAAAARAAVASKNKGPAASQVGDLPAAVESMSLGQG